MRDAITRLMGVIEYKWLGGKYSQVCLCCVHSWSWWSQGNVMLRVSNVSWLWAGMWNSSELSSLLQKTSWVLSSLVRRHLCWYYQLDLVLDDIYDALFLETSIYGLLVFYCWDQHCCVNMCTSSFSRVPIILTPDRLWILPKHSRAIWILVLH